MNIKDLKAGPHTLTRDVVNPSPDLRTKNDWTRTGVWREGTLFVLVERLGVLSIRKPGELDHIWMNRAEGRAIAEALNPSADPIHRLKYECEERLGALRQCAEGILIELVQTNKVSVQDAVVACEAWLAKGA